MNKLIMLIGDINNELESAECFAMSAVENKSCDKELFDMYMNIANISLGNVSTMQNVFNKRAITSSTGGPDELKEFYNWENSEIIERIAKIKSIIECAKKP